MKAIERIINNAIEKIKEEFENCSYKTLEDVTTTYNKLAGIYKQKIDNMKTSGLFTADEIDEVTKALSECFTTNYNEQHHKVRAMLRMSYEF